MEDLPRVNIIVTAPKTDGTVTQTGLSNLQVEVAHKMLALITKERWQIGDRISDAAIARELHVSRSPVRQVLHLLVQRGIVAQAPNRGYLLQRFPEHDELSNEILPPSDFEDLYHRLMNARASGAVGLEISEAALADQFEVTRGTVRRTLMRFAAEGLAERLPGYGWRFAETLDNEHAVHESDSFRMVIECGALTQADYSPVLSELQELKKAQIEILERSISDFPDGYWFDVNANFHETLVSWANNRFLTQTIRWQNHLRRLTESCEVDRLCDARIHQACTDHLEILQAIEAGDFEFAAALLKRHIARPSHDGV